MTCRVLGSSRIFVVLDWQEKLEDYHVPCLLLLRPPVCVWLGESCFRHPDFSPPPQGSHPLFSVEKVISLLKIGSWHLWLLQQGKQRVCVRGLLPLLSSTGLQTGSKIVSGFFLNPRPCFPCCIQKRASKPDWLNVRLLLPCLWGNTWILLQEGWEVPYLQHRQGSRLHSDVAFCVQ